MRAFWAFELPDSVIKELSRRQESLRPHYRNFKWVKPANIHLTLHFLGEIKPEQIHPMSQKFCLALRDQRSLRVHLGETGVFPGWNNPRVLWIALGGETDALREIHRTTAKILNTQGMRLDGRAFSPHITLARIDHNPATDYGRIKSASAMSAGIMSRENIFPLKKLVLYASQLTPNGPIYTPCDFLDFA